MSFSWVHWTHGINNDFYSKCDIRTYKHVNNTKRNGKFCVTLCENCQWFPLFKMLQLAGETMKYSMKCENWAMANT